MDRGWLMSRWPRAIPWGTLAVALVAGSLGAAGGAYVVGDSRAGAPLAEEAGTPVMLERAPRVQPEAPTATPASPARPRQQLAPAQPAPAQPRQALAPGQAVAKPAPPGAAFGLVTAIVGDPLSFSFRTEAGEVIRVRVLETTVFAAGVDRPYNFGLLKVGDGVWVRFSATGMMDGAARRGRVGGRMLAEPAEGESVARQVTVRPAGEGPARQAQAGRGSVRGGGDGAVQ